MNNTNFFQNELFILIIFLPLLNFIICFFFKHFFNKFFLIYYIIFNIFFVLVLIITLIIQINFFYYSYPVVTFVEE